MVQSKLPLCFLEPRCAQKLSVHPHSVCALPQSSGVWLIPGVLCAGRISFSWVLVSHGTGHWALGCGISPELCLEHKGQNAAFRPFTLKKISS